MSTTSQPVTNQIRALMWPVLLVALGFSWYLTREASGLLKVDAMYTLATALAAWWLHVHFCSDEVEKGKLIMLLLAAATVGLVYFAGQYSTLASVSLIVVLIWLLMAEQIQLPRIQLPSIRLQMPVTVEPASAT